MAAAKFIEYDRDHETVEITGATAEFTVFLRVTEAIERPGESEILHLQ